MADTAAIDVASQKWDDVWELLTETGEISLDDLDSLRENQRESVVRALDELADLGFVTADSDQTWMRAF